ncbi:EAL domain-containing protein [Parasphingorhabdus halotolerans]|uniref:EAL domain-containing protein n=1 Tax=Parasphingorhabdus halotolerans TaxID=2725558 RepID=A0A6H2DKA3_9SPHN|nr:EAL domain-containing protein [Parasphingorhabdus halotolerans]QJB68567.1 EAL domain-containing protein [Parasphingorhabdus halotolerans]
MNLRRNTASIEPLPAKLAGWTSLGIVPSSDNDSVSQRIADDILALSSFWPLIPLVKVAGLIFLYLADQNATLSMHAMTMSLAASTFFFDLCICGAAKFKKFKTLQPYLQLRFMLVFACLSGITFAVFQLSLIDLQSSPLLAASCVVFQCFTTMIVAIIAGKQRIVGVSFSTGVVAVLFFALPFFAFGFAFLIFVSAAYVATLEHIRRDHADNLRIIEKRQGEKRASLLLTEYENAGLGWFWETDRDGKIIYISDSIRKYSSDTFEDLIGQSLTNLIAPFEAASSSPSGERTLGFHLSSRSAFKEISVQSVIFGEERWWSLSGNPIFSPYGQFQGFRGSGTDLTAMRRSQDEVKQLAQFDSLTGLSNRLQMLGILEKALIDQMGATRPCALFLLDLDRFKTVNDTLGHPAGDALLKQVSQRIQRVIGSQGHAGRIGGDEFKVVLPDIYDRKPLASLADAVIATLTQPYMIEGTQITIGASIGIAIAPEHGGTTESLIRNADLALYAAKDGGRGIHRFYDRTMHADAEDRRNLEQELRQALSADQFHLVYQPQVSTANEEISGYEALLRWNHPVRGYISPAVFIPIAEEAGLITQIGEWALRTACDEVAKWPRNVKIAVNVSPIQFANPGFPAVVMNALSRSQLDPGRLELEITESVFLNEGDNTDQMFANLKSIGIRLSLDDFGTGYSSLSYLKKAPFDKIKIDQSFVRGASIAGNRNAAIIRSIVSLAEALDMETIAEGAETHDELALIRDLGCSHVQGYIYSKPLVANEAVALLAEGRGPLVPTGLKSSRHPRRTVLRSIAVIHDNYRYDAQLRNIAINGALVVGLWDVPPGTELMLELAPDYACFATACWSEGDKTGVQFAEAIDFKRLSKTTPSVKRSLARDPKAA